MAWKPRDLDGSKREHFVFGDKPYGAYWEEVPDAAVPPPPTVASNPSLEDVVESLKQANIAIKPASVRKALDGAALQPG